MNQCLLYLAFASLWLTIGCDQFNYYENGNNQNNDDDSDEFIDELIDYNSGYNSHRPVLDFYPSFKQKKSIVNSDKIFDYLNSIQSQVLKNDDVLTIKDKNLDSFNNNNNKKTSVSAFVSSTTTTMKPNILVTTKQLDFSSSPDSEIQSDQPYTVANVNSNNAATHKSNPNNKYLLLANNINDNNGNNKDDNNANPIIPNLNNPKPWQCQLSAKHSCGMVNDQIVGQYFKLKNYNFVDSTRYQWHLWYLMLNSSEFLPGAAGARLITPYFESKNVPTGCLRFEYVTLGRQFEKMVVYQQDKENHCVWSSEVQPESPDKPSIEVVNLSIDLRQGDPRFFIEVYPTRRRSSEPSILALSEFSFTYRPCSLDNANQCRPPPRQPVTFNAVIP